MTVVSDTTPIISLLKINHLDLLRDLFGDVLIPESVFFELTANPVFQKEIEIIKNCDFLRLVVIDNQSAVTEIRNSTGLDLGESEAIVFARDNNADLLLMDEVKGRRIATEMGLSISGTIGVLIAAYNAGMITKAEIMKCADILRSNNRHISEKLYKQLLEI